MVQPKIVSKNTPPALYRTRTALRDRLTGAAPDSRVGTGLGDVIGRDYHPRSLLAYAGS